MTKHHGHNLPISLEQNGPQEPIVRSSGTGQAEQLPGEVSVGWISSGNQPQCDPQDADKWDNSLAPQPAATESIDFNKLRDLLFSIRDNNIYCPECRCPEWSSSYPEMRTSHYENCNLGSACEKLLRMYPKAGAVVKWRK